MTLKIIGSSSAGNCYILGDSKEALILECGVRFDLINRGLNFNLNKVVGLLCTHSHGDHCKAVADVAKFGINVYASEGTCEELAEIYNPNPHRLRPIQTKVPFRLGGFRIIAFDVEHDTKQPVGFLIDHADTGLILFLTDTVYSPYRFPGLSQVIVEANYCEHILEEKRQAGATIDMLRDRVIESHMSFQNTKQLLKANDLTQVKNIVLIHLSNSHSHARRFKHEAEQLTGKQVHIAEAGMEIDLNKSPF
jgi:phosphoribosyl 1,2-cyclic phosphodiesterase